MPLDMVGLHRTEEPPPRHASELCPCPHDPVPRKRNPVWVGILIMLPADPPGITADHGLRDCHRGFRDRLITAADTAVE